MKALRTTGADISGGFAEVKESRLSLQNVYIGQWQGGMVGTHISNRERQLLAHKNEIRQIAKLQESRHQLVRCWYYRLVLLGYGLMSPAVMSTIRSDVTYSSF